MKKNKKMLAVILSMTAITGTAIMQMNAEPVEEEYYEEYYDDMEYYETEEEYEEQEESETITEHMMEPEPEWFEQGKEDLAQENSHPVTYKKNGEDSEIPYIFESRLITLNEKHPYGLFRCEVKGEFKQGDMLEIKALEESDIWNICRMDERMDECLSDGFDISGFSKEKDGFKYEMPDAETEGLYFFLEPKSETDSFNISASINTENDIFTCEEILKTCQTGRYTKDGEAWTKSNDGSLFIGYENMGNMEDEKYIRCHLAIQDMGEGGVISVWFPGGMNGIEATGYIYESEEEDPLKTKELETLQGFFCAVDGRTSSETRYFHFDLAMGKDKNMAVPIYVTYEQNGERRISKNEISFSKEQADVSLSIGNYEEGMEEVPFIINAVPLDMNCGGMFLELACQHNLWEEADGALANNKYKILKERISTGELVSLEGTIPVSVLEESTDLTIRAYVEGWADKLTFKRSSYLGDGVTETDERFLIHYER